jgi:RNA polymerase sigma-70 factor (ECF subfamily)
MDFERLSQQHKDAVYRQMLRVCGNREDAEDVLIEALMKAYRSLDGLGAPEAFRTWLGRIANRVCWQLKRREALLPLLQLSVLEEGAGEVADGSPSAEEQAGAAEMKQIFAAALHSLPEEARVVYQRGDGQAARPLAPSHEEPVAASAKAAARAVGCGAGRQPAAWAEVTALWT